MALAKEEARVVIWNPAAECMPLEEKRMLQLRRLQRIVEYVYHRVPFYRKAFDEHKVKPEDIRTLDDIRRLPFTKKTDLVANYPFGMWAVPLEEIVRLQSTSGTTAKPIVMGYTRNDTEMWAEAMARTYQLCGVTADDVVQNAYGYALFTGGMGFHIGAEKIGATLIPAGPGMTQRQIMLMLDLGTTVLTCTPSYALTIADTLASMNIDRSKLKLRVGIFGAEPWTEEMRRTIEEGLGLEAYDIYGFTEMCGPGVACECLYHDGLHIQDDLFYPEVVDPDTEEPLPPGEKGDLVFTSLTREGVPLIRYRTKDITSLEYEPCRCGRTTPRFRKITGRIDDMLIIRGVNVFPSQIETVILQYRELAPQYQIIVDRVKNLDTLEVQVEATEEFWAQGEEARRNLAAQVQAKLTQAIIATADITILAPRTLPRIEAGKARRVVDKRRLG
ncbi:MAG: phenylacetate--CoA ligase [Clostridia bacterium]|nr:phenylacetate--CoA ligase [Clostridia bacterium]